MSKRSSSRGTGSSGPSQSSRGSAGSSSQSSSNSRMWSKPASPRQRAALKANGNDDGKYYSKGRAGQTIGKSVRSAGTSKPRSIGRGRAGRSPLPAPASPSAGVVAISAVESASMSADIVLTPLAMQTLASPHLTPADEGSFGFHEFLSLYDELMEGQLRNLQGHLSAYSACREEQCPPRLDRASAGPLAR